MAQRCPKGHGTANVETLLDRFRCLECGTYFDQQGREVEGGLKWTTRVPDTHAEDARRTAQAAKSQRKAKR